MLKFFKWLYIVGASFFGIVILAFLPEASNNKPLILAYFVMAIMCALNAVVFHKLDRMDDDVIAIKKNLSRIDAELIAIKKSIRKLNETQNQSDNTHPQQD